MRTSARRGGENPRRAVLWLVIGIIAAGAAPARALSTDRDQPIDIKADRAERDDSRRVMIYRGNVVIDQGSLHITGDAVTIHFDARDEITKMVSVGAPAHFRQLPDGEVNLRKAWAKRMEYFPGEDFIVLFGDASYEKGHNRVQADRLVYDSGNARFKAMPPTPGAPPASAGEAGAEESERVRIRIDRKQGQTQ